MTPRDPRIFGISSHNCDKLYMKCNWWPDFTHMNESSEWFIYNFFNEVINLFSDVNCFQLFATTLNGRYRTRMNWTHSSFHWFMKTKVNCFIHLWARSSITFAVDIMTREWNARLSADANSGGTSTNKRKYLIHHALSSHQLPPHYPSRQSSPLLYCYCVRQLGC